MLITDTDTNVHQCVRCSMSDVLLALCLDVDECETGTHRCSEGQICHNLPGSYRCDCQTGYQYDAIRRVCIGMFNTQLRKQLQNFALVSNARSIQAS